MKMLIGFLFSLGIIAYSIYKRDKHWELTVLVAIIGAIVFLGQFVGGLSG